MLLIWSEWYDQEWLTARSAWFSPRLYRPIDGIRESGENESSNFLVIRAEFEK